MSAPACLGRATAVAGSPGYLRLSVPGLYRSQDRKQAIEDRLSAFAHVTEVLASPLTGKVRVLFDPAVPVAAMLNMLGVAAANEETVRAAQPRTPYPRPRSSRQPNRTPGNRLAAAPPAPSYPPWHNRDAEQVLAHYRVSADAGLSNAEAEWRLRAGPNRLPPPATRSPAELLAAQFKSVPIALLAVSALLSAATGGVAEALSIAAVLVLNAGIGYATEKHSAATISSLMDLVNDRAAVVRDGYPTVLPADRLVPGDLILLASGAPVPADARVIRSNRLSIDESALTGESLPVPKHAAALPAAAPLADRANMVYMGTAVAGGSGLAVVVGTGARTEIGAIQRAIERTEQPKTPIQREMDGLGNRLVGISGLICAAVFGLGLLRGQGWLQMLKSSLSLAIAAVPEGLPTVATTSLARGLHVMRAKQMLIRRLHAVEAIGATHTLCFDKTGTLTLNRMDAVSATVGVRRLPLADGRLSADRHGIHEDDLGRLLQLCVLSNEEHANGDDRSAFLSSGSSTENALVRFAETAGVDAGATRTAFPVLEAQLRAEGRNYMRTLHATPDGGRLVAVKGSPLEVLALCSRMQQRDQVGFLSPELRRAVEAENEAMARAQLRVLGFAYLQLPAGADAMHAEDGLVWVGLVGLADPLREGAAQVIEALHRAGVRTAMITGDQRATAQAIGASVGLSNGPELSILDSAGLEGSDREQLAALAANADVFARVSPAAKLQIVRALQQDGRVVAMTGDGINDGPALRAADVGIAMGRHGTDLARSAADMVLADDKLETMLDAIRQGRTITVNIRKSLHFLISSNLSEILVVLATVAATGSPPLNPMQLLWINLLSDVLPAIAIAAEPDEDDVMQKPPRDPGRPLISNEDLKRYGIEGTILAGGALSAHAYGLLRYGNGSRAGSLAFNALMLGQLLHAYTCRSEQQGLLTHSRRNLKLDLAIGGSIALQLAANLVPALRRLLGLGGAGLADLAVVLAAAGIPLMANNAGKPGPGRAARTG